MSDCITKFHRGLVSFALTTAGITALGFGAYSLYQQNASTAVTGLGAGLLLLFGATIDRFELIKGLGIEAKTRFEQKINEAEQLLKHIKELAASRGSSLIALHTAAANGSPQERIIQTYD